MGTLGISIYPEKSDFESDKTYLELAKKYGFSRIFMNLLLSTTDDVTALVAQLRQTITYGNELGFDTYIDVNKNTLDAFGIEPRDLAPFAEMGIKGVRLDMGFSGMEEAIMTKNSLGLNIEINMSNDDHYLERVLDYNPNRKQLVGCHNFFPQGFTGLSTEYFVHCSKRFQEKNLHTAAFVTSQVGKIGPWALHEGLCTLEAHRHLPIASQVKHLKFLNVVDDIIIGNAYASEDELRKMSEAFYEERLTLSVEKAAGITEQEEEIIEKPTQTYRGDRSEYMIRSSYTRFTYANASIPKKDVATPIKRGDVLILNEDYGEYKAEVQLALKDRPQDDRVNVVGHICPNDMILIDEINPYSTFKLKFID